MHQNESTADQNPDVKLFFLLFSTEHLMAMHPAPGRDILHNTRISGNYQKFIAFLQHFHGILRPNDGQGT